MSKREEVRGEDGQRERQRRRDRRRERNYGDKKPDPSKAACFNKMCLSSFFLILSLSQ